MDGPPLAVAHQPAAVYVAHQPAADRLSPQGMVSVVVELAQPPVPADASSSSSDTLRMGGGGQESLSAGQGPRFVGRS